MNMMSDEILRSSVLQYVAVCVLWRACGWIWCLTRSWGLFFLRVLPHIWTSLCHTCECLDEYAVWQDLEVHFLVTHAAHIDESCHTRECVDENALWWLFESLVLVLRVMSQNMDESRHTRKCVDECAVWRDFEVPFFVNHSATMDESCHTRECVDKYALWRDLEVHFFASHVAHMDESCRTRQCVD